MIKIPEIQLIKIVRQVLSAYEEEYKQAVNKDTTLLADMYKGLTYEDYNLYEEAIALFVTNRALTQSASNRKLSIKGYYDRNQKNTPVIHITAPTEEDYLETIGGGMGEVEAQYFAQDNQVREIRAKRYKSRHVIVFTSDSHIEVQLMYFTVKALLISYFDEFILDQFQDPSFSGNELRVEDNGTAPENFYIRALTIESFTDIEILNAFKSENFTKLLLPRSNSIEGGDIGDSSMTITTTNNIE